MALNKSIETGIGVDASYHRIMSVRSYFGDGCLDVTMAGYVDLEARQAGRQPMLAADVRLTFEQVGSLEPNRAQIYTAIKALPEFEGAGDC